MVEAKGYKHILSKACTTEDNDPHIYYKHITSDIAAINYSNKAAQEDCSPNAQDAVAQALS